MKKLVKKLGIGLALAVIVTLAVAGVAAAQDPAPYRGGDNN